MLDILTSLDLEDVDWIFRHLWKSLSDTNETVEISAALNLISHQIQVNGKEVVGG